jgi:hypothetical protein
VQEFVQELPHTSASDAWQRAVMLTAGSRLDIDAEPRIRKSAVDELPRANHPFFWAGYMLIDCGAPLPKADQPAEPPVVKVKPEEPAAKPVEPKPEELKPRQPKPEEPSINAEKPKQPEPALGPPP